MKYSNVLRKIEKFLYYKIKRITINLKNFYIIKEKLLEFLRIQNR